MTAMLESEAVFAARASAMGVTAATLQLMKNCGWATLGAFGFACSYVPGQTDDASFKLDILTALFNTASHPQASTVRRLYFEAYSMCAADMRTRLERTGEDPPKKLPQPERQARFQALTASLPGYLLEGPLEVCHQLVDTLVQCLEDGVVKYIPWSECLTRDMEMLSVKKDKFWKPDNLGHVKEFETSTTAFADVSTDLKLSQALFRRGMAFSMSGLMHFDTHAKLAQLLMAQLEYVPPPGYAPISIAQLEMADKEVFRQLANACRTGLLPDMATGSRPLDHHLPLVLNDVRVRMMLQPLAASSSGTNPNKRVVATGGGGATPVQSPSAKKRAKKAAAKQLQTAIPVRSKPTAKVQPGKFVAMPAALRGQNAVTNDGSRICFGWNLGTCSNQNNCPKGKHVCCRCFAGHPFMQNGIGCTI